MEDRLVCAVCEDGPKVRKLKGCGHYYCPDCLPADTCVCGKAFTPKDVLSYARKKWRPVKVKVKVPPKVEAPPPEKKFAVDGTFVKLL